MNVKSGCFDRKYLFSYDIETAVLIRYEALLKEKRFIPCSFLGSGLEGKDASAADGKDQLNVLIEKFDLEKHSNKVYYVQPLNIKTGTIENFLNLKPEKKQNLFVNVNRDNIKDIPIIVHFSISQMNDKFSLLLEYKKFLDKIKKRVLFVGTKQYSSLFDIDVFNYELLDDFSVNEFERYLEGYINIAIEENYECIYLSIPGGILDSLNKIQMINYVYNRLTRYMTIVSVPYCHNIEELKYYSQLVTKHINNKPNIIHISNIVVDWKRTNLKSNLVEYYVIDTKKDWLSFRVDNCNIGSSIIDIYNEKNIEQIYSIYKKNLG